LNQIRPHRELGCWQRKGIFQVIGHGCWVILAPKNSGIADKRRKKAIKSLQVKRSDSENIPRFSGYTRIVLKSYPIKVYG
jgi:hypothetical protein